MTSLWIRENPLRVQCQETNNSNRRYNRWINRLKWIKRISNKSSHRQGRSLQFLRTYLSKRLKIAELKSLGVVATSHRVTYQRQLREESHPLRSTQSTVECLIAAAAQAVKGLWARAWAEKGHLLALQCLLHLFKIWEVPLSHKCLLGLLRHQQNMIKWSLTVKVSLVRPQRVLSQAINIWIWIQLKNRPRSLQTQRTEATGSQLDMAHSMTTDASLKEGRTSRVAERISTTGTIHIFQLRFHRWSTRDKTRTVIGLQPAKSTIICIGRSEHCPLNPRRTTHKEWIAAPSDTTPNHRNQLVLTIRRGIQVLTMWAD